MNYIIINEGLMENKLVKEGQCIINKFWFSTGAYGIYCFQCNSHMDPECETIKANDTSSKFYKLCESTEGSAGKEMFCRKTVQKSK